MAAPTPDVGNGRYSRQESAQDNPDALALPARNRLQVRVALQLCQAISPRRLHRRWYLARLAFALRQHSILPSDRIALDHCLDGFWLLMWSSNFGQRFRFFFTPPQIPSLLAACSRYNCAAVLGCSVMSHISARPLLPGRYFDIPHWESIPSSSF